MKTIKKFCPVTQRSCDYDLCGWFNDVTGECAVTTLSHKLSAISRAVEPVISVEKKAKSKGESK